MKDLPRATIAKNSLINNGILIHMSSDQKIIDTVNKIAPEHWSLILRTIKIWLEKLKIQDLFVWVSMLLWL